MTSTAASIAHRINVRLTPRKAPRVQTFVTAEQVTAKGVEIGARMMFGEYTLDSASRLFEAFTAQAAK